MDFKTAMEHYKSGTASEEERILVEAELEKSQLIDEFLDAPWDASPVPEDTPAEEFGKEKTFCASAASGRSPSVWRW